MGGDHAPDAILAGCLEAIDLLRPSDRLVLVGDPELIRPAVKEHGNGDGRLELEPATQVIGMDEPPITAIRTKSESSIVRLARLGGRRHSGNRHCDVIISAGNTGACVAAAQMEMRRLPHVHRPGIAVPMPTFHGPVVICDVGANPDPKAHHLLQYAHMAAVYAHRMVEVESPRIALMSIGGEEGKGNALVREAHCLIKQDTRLNYVGYIEGRDLFDGKADVVITEGFTGNVVLKLAEGLAAGLFKTITAEAHAIDPNLARQFEPVVAAIYKKHDYHEYGGAPLLGAKGTCMICHGSSKARTILSAVKAAIRYTKMGVNAGIVETLGKDMAIKEGAA